MSIALPDSRVVREEARHIYNDVAQLFKDCLSPDHDVEDVEIGHSYFLIGETESNGESEDDIRIHLANKIIYQVVPILREYLKDGVLGKEAKPKIDAIEEAAKNLGKFDRVGERINLDKGPGWYWVHAESGGHSEPAAARQMVHSLIRHYVDMGGVSSLEELQEAFPDNCSHSGPVVVALDKNDKSSKYLIHQPITLGDGTLAVVRGTWGRGEIYFRRFAERACEFGYEIYENWEADYRHFCRRQ